MRLMNIRIISKIIIPSIILTIIFIGVVLYGILGMSDIKDHSLIVFDQYLKKALLANEAYIHLDNITTSDRDQVFAPSEAKRAENEKSYNDDIKAGVDDLDKLSTLTQSPEERAKIDTIKNKVALYEKIERNAFEIAKKGERDKAYTLIIGDAMSAYNDATGPLDEIVKSAVQDTLEQRKIINQRYDSVLLWSILVAIAGLFVGFGILFYIVVVHITGPLKSSVTALKELSEGNLAIEVKGADRGDETGLLARSLSIFRDAAVKQRKMHEEQQQETQRKLDRQQRVDKLVSDFDKTASSAVSSVAAAATELSQTATDMSNNAVSTSQQAASVAKASTETSNTVQSVAAAVEEMSASVKEISSQVARSVSISREASTEAKNATITSSKMLEAALSIGSVAEMIEGIAGQINLLALNATIESARAGEAGKGFAVVASEVKNLANQTTKATEDIRQKLTGVQQMARDVSEALTSLGGAVERVDEVSGGIASAVEEQTAVTQEITMNMNNAAQGVGQINSNIDGIRRSTEGTSAATQQILGASGMLSRQAEELNAQMQEFLYAIKAV